MIQVGINTVIGFLVFVFAGELNKLAFIFLLDYCNIRY